jgi:hypothetical protein
MSRNEGWRWELKANWRCAMRSQNVPTATRHTSNPTARMSARPLPCGTTPGRIV